MHKSLQIIFLGVTFLGFRPPGTNAFKEPDIHSCLVFSRIFRVTLVKAVLKIHSFLPVGYLLERF